MNKKQIIWISIITVLIMIILCTGAALSGAFSDCDEDDRREGDIDCVLYWERKKANKNKPKVTPTPSTSIVWNPAPASSVRKVTPTSARKK